MLATGGTAFLFVAVLNLSAQEFDVASVKLSAPRPATIAGRGGAGPCGVPFRADRDRVEISCAPMATLISYAYRLPPALVQLPDFMTGRNGPRFDIEAKLPAAAPTSKIPEMLQALLAKRFQLAFHRGRKEQEVYGLVAARGGPKLKAADPDAKVREMDDANAEITHPQGIETRMIRTQAADGGSIIVLRNERLGTVRETRTPADSVRWEAPNITLEGLADLLGGIGLVAEVVDLSGLKGRYQIDLEISLQDAFAAAGELLAIRGGSPAAGAPPTAGTIQDARVEMDAAICRSINKSLSRVGLQLERKKTPLEFLIVDHVEKTPSEN